MKSLQESVFDSDLAVSDLPYEKLLKSNILMRDINDIVFECVDSATDLDTMRNKQLKEWGEEMVEKYLKNSKCLYFCSYGIIDEWDRYKGEDMDNANEEAENWLKPGVIHTSLHWNDAMYASQFNIHWKVWGKEKDWRNITEWIMWKVNAVEEYAMFLINRKEFDSMDQQVIHKLIETVSKKYKYKKGTR